jgi:ADP-ribosylglycohydrolase
MRSAIIGAYFYDEPERRKTFVYASTRLTHTDPKAETAAMAVAEAAAWAVVQGEPLGDLVSRFALLGHDAEWLRICRKLETALARGDRVASFADSLGLAKGVSGYCYHSVPVALCAWLASPNNYPQALIPALDCGGDTDTTGAIVGALAGASAKPSSIPDQWRNRIWEWPRSVEQLSRVASRLARQKDIGRAQGAVCYFWPALVLRNLVFLALVLVHGFGRLPWQVIDNQ